MEETNICTISEEQSERVASIISKEFRNLAVVGLSVISKEMAKGRIIKMLLDCGISPEDGNTEVVLEKLKVILSTFDVKIGDDTLPVVTTVSAPSDPAPDNVRIEFVDRVVEKVIIQKVPVERIVEKIVERKVPVEVVREVIKEVIVYKDVPSEPLFPQEKYEVIRERVTGDITNKMIRQGQNFVVDVKVFGEEVAQMNQGLSDAKDLCYVVAQGYNTSKLQEYGRECLKSARELEAFYERLKELAGAISHCMPRNE